MVRYITPPLIHNGVVYFADGDGGYLFLAVV